MPRFSILIPHYKTGLMTAYAIAQILKYSDRDKIDITVIDNYPEDGSADLYLEPFKDDIVVCPYPSALMQSHGIAYDYILEAVPNEYFITLESDSFPVQKGWLDYYEQKIEEGYDSVGSRLKLSGGEYLHPCGAMYRKSMWEEASHFCEKTPYEYFPNMAMRSGHAYNLMVHASIIGDFLENPDDYIELADSYKPYTWKLAEDKLRAYRPITGPFHNGMGGRDDSSRYGERTIESEAGFVLLKNAKKLVYRVGYEPGQWLSAFQMATGRKLFFVPTETKWMKGEEGRQQEYTLMESGIRHLWGITAYHDSDLGEPEIARIKQAIPDILYSTLPDHQKI